MAAARVIEMDREDMIAVMKAGALVSGGCMALYSIYKIMEENDTVEIMEQDMNFDKTGGIEARPTIIKVPVLPIDGSPVDCAMAKPVDKFLYMPQEGSLVDKYQVKKRSSTTVLVPEFIPKDGSAVDKWLTTPMEGSPVDKVRYYTQMIQRTNAVRNPHQSAESSSVPNTSLAAENTKPAHPGGSYGQLPTGGRDDQVAAHMETKEAVGDIYGEEWVECGKFLRRSDRCDSKTKAGKSESIPELPRKRSHHDFIDKPIPIDVMRNMSYQAEYDGTPIDRPFEYTCGSSVDPAPAPVEEPLLVAEKIPSAVFESIERQRLEAEHEFLKDVPVSYVTTEMKGPEMGDGFIKTEGTDDMKKDEGGSPKLGSQTNLKVIWPPPPSVSGESAQSSPREGIPCEHVGHKILMLGQSGVGKTSITNYWSTIYKSENKMLDHYDSILMKTPGLKLNILDVDGNKDRRKKWTSLYSDTELVIYVVDSAAKRSVLEEDARILQKLMIDERLNRVPILLLAHKQDIPYATNHMNLVETLHLKGISPKVRKVMVVSTRLPPTTPHKRSSSPSVNDPRSMKGLEKALRMVMSTIAEVTVSD